MGDMFCFQEGNSSENGWLVQMIHFLLKWSNGPFFFLGTFVHFRGVYTGDEQLPRYILWLVINRKESRNLSYQQFFHGDCQPRSFVSVAQVSMHEKLWQGMSSGGLPFHVQPQYVIYSFLWREESNLSRTIPLFTPCLGRAQSMTIQSTNICMYIYIYTYKYATTTKCIVSLTMLYICKNMLKTANSWASWLWLVRSSINPNDLPFLKLTVRTWK